MADWRSPFWAGAWFGELADHESFDQVRRRLENVAVDRRWWESLLIAGDEIGLRFQRMPGAVADLLKQGEESARKTPGSACRRPTA